MKALFKNLSTLIDRKLESQSTTRQVLIVFGSLTLVVACIFQFESQLNRAAEEDVKTYQVGDVSLSLPRSWQFRTSYQEGGSGKLLFEAIETVHRSRAGVFQTPLITLQCTILAGNYADFDKLKPHATAKPGPPAAPGQPLTAMGAMGVKDLLFDGLPAVETQGPLAKGPDDSPAQQRFIHALYVHGRKHNYLLRESIPMLELGPRKPLLDRLWSSIHVR